MTNTDNVAPALSEQHTRLLLQVTGRSDLADALHWIAERRLVADGLTNTLLIALVSAADCGLPSSDAALRVAARSALRSTLDTSADLVSTDSIVSPHRYQRALAEIAERTPTGSLADINAQAAGAAQAENPLVIEALGLIAGLSWRDLRDRSETRGVPLPSKPTGPWKSSQIKSVFDLVDEVVTGQVRPQLVEAVAARPLELLLGSSTCSWSDIEALRTGGVSYGTLLAQRDVGSAWSAHRNRTNNEISRLMILRLLEALSTAGVTYWSTEGDSPVPRDFLSRKAVKQGKTPGQLVAVTRSMGGSPRYAVLVSVARDGGTARKTAATFLELPDLLALPGVVLLVGTGWADRGESDKLVRAFGGRVYTEHSLPALAAMAAELSEPADTMTNPDAGQEQG